MPHLCVGFKPLNVGSWFYPILVILNNRTAQKICDELGVEFRASGVNVGTGGYFE
jgi:hypothetical protein